MAMLRAGKLGNDPVGAVMNGALSHKEKAAVLAELDAMFDEDEAEDACNCEEVCACHG